MSMRLAVVDYDLNGNSRQALGINQAQGGGAPLGDAAPAGLGAAAAGASSSCSREDHIHDMPTAANVGAASAGHNHDAAYAAIVHSHSAATGAAAGFMSAADKTKLDGISPSTFSLTVVEKDIGAPARQQGSMDITGLSNLTPGRPVVAQQAAAACTGKGTLPDEVEMDQARVTAYVVDASTVRLYWDASPGYLMSNVKFAYGVA